MYFFQQKFKLNNQQQHKARSHADERKGWRIDGYWQYLCLSLNNNSVFALIISDSGWFQSLTKMNSYMRWSETKYTVREFILMYWACLWVRFNEYAISGCMWALNFTYSY